MTALRLKPADYFTIFIIVVFAVALVEASEWVLRASILVLVLGSVGLVLGITQLALDMRRRQKQMVSTAPVYETPSFDDADPKLVSRNSLIIWGWLVGLVLAVPIVGLPVALTGFVFIYAWKYGASWWLAAILATLNAMFIYGIYVRLMHVYWPWSLLDLTLDKYF